jgi:hypothetical protein
LAAGACRTTARRGKQQEQTEAFDLLHRPENWHGNEKPKSQKLVLVIVRFEGFPLPSSLPAGMCVFILKKIEVPASLFKDMREQWTLCEGAGGLQ